MGQYAVLLNADTDRIGPAANGLEYALDRDDAGHHVEVCFDGAATPWVPELESDSSNPVHKYYADAREREIIGGACGYCADSFGVYDEVGEADVERIGGRDEHGPDVGALVEDGYELLPVG